MIGDVVDKKVEALSLNQVCTRLGISTPATAALAERMDCAALGHYLSAWVAQEVIPALPS